MRFRAVLVALALTFGAAGAGSALADTSGPYTLVTGSFGTQLGVHSNGTQTGNVIFGHVNQEGSLVTLSSDDTLSVTGGGEATFNGPFDDLDITFQHPWQSVTFAFDAGASDANMALLVNGTNLFASPSCTICTLSANGEQKFILSGPAISTLDFTFTNPSTGAPEDVLNIKQIRVEGPVNPGIPEPATWALMILGVGFTGFAARRRGAAATLAV